MVVTLAKTPLPACPVAFNRNHGIAPASGASSLVSFLPITSLPSSSLQVASPCEVAADVFSAVVGQLRLRTFQRPRKLSIGAGLANVDLRARSMRHEHDILILGRCDYLVDVRARGFLRGRGAEKQEGDCSDECREWHHCGLSLARSSNCCITGTSLAHLEAQSQHVAATIH